MLNIFSITSIKANDTQTNGLPRNDDKKPPFIDSNSKHGFENVAKGNMNSVSNTPQPNTSFTYFSIKCLNEEYFHPYQVKKCINFDAELNLFDRPDDKTVEYLYCPGNEKIYNTTIVRFPPQVYQSPIIKMGRNHKVKAQIHVNNPKTNEFNFRSIALGESIVFFTLIKTQQRVYVSSIFFFFKYQKEIHCSIQQIDFGFTIEEVEEIIQNSRQYYIEDSLRNNSEEVSEYAIKQIEIILQDENSFNKMLNLEDAAKLDFVDSGYKIIKKVGEQDPIRIVRAKEENNYNEKYWQRGNIETCGHIYSKNDNMITTTGFHSNRLEYGLPLIWRIGTSKNVYVFRIINSKIDRRFLKNCSRLRRKFIIPFGPTNQQTTFEKREYVFFCCNGIENTFYCVKKVDGVFQTVEGCDIYNMIFILKTTNVFYFMTHNSPALKRSLFTISEETEYSSDSESTSSNISGFEREEQNVLNPLKEEGTFDEDFNTLEDKLIEHSLKKGNKEAKNQLSDSNISSQNELNTTIDVFYKESAFTNEKGTTNSQNIMSMNVCCDNGPTNSHKIGDHQLKLESLDEKVLIKDAVYLLDPINKLVSKDKIVLSENSNVTTVSIEFIETEGPFKKVLSFEESEFFENKKDFHFLPFYFITEEGNEIRVNKTLIFIYAGNNDILYCHTVKTDISLKDFEELKNKDVTKYIRKILGKPNTWSVKETVSVLRTKRFFDILQDKNSYIPVSSNTHNEVFPKQFVVGGLANDSSKSLKENTTVEKSKTKVKKASKTNKNGQPVSFSLITRSRNFFRRLRKNIKK